MTNTSTEQQIEVWKKELAIAMENEQWRLALKLCGWLRYALRQQELSAPNVEKAHRQAKEALAKQLANEKDIPEKRRRQRNRTMGQIISGDWEQALTSIEALYQNGTNRQEAIDLLQEFEARTRTRLSSALRQKDPQARAIGEHFDGLVERIAGGSLPNRT